MGVPVVVPAFMLVSLLHGFLAFLGDKCNNEQILIEDVMSCMRTKNCTVDNWHLEERYDEWIKPLLARTSIKLGEFLDREGGDNGRGETCINIFASLAVLGSKNYRPKSKQKRLENHQKKLGDYMIKDKTQLIIPVDPVQAIRQLVTSLCGFSHFLHFLRLLQNDHYEGHFALLLHIMACHVFQKIGNFMLKFQLKNFATKYSGLSGAWK
jgi:hypothetical protein